MTHPLLSMLAAGTLLASGAAALAQAPAAPPPPPPHAGHSFFEEMDINKDGVVTRAEVTAVLEKRFAALDTDHNGVISPAERQAQRDRKWDERFAALDSDKNGQLSPAEFRAARERKGPPGPDAGAPPPRGMGFARGPDGKGPDHDRRGGWGKGPGGGRDGAPDGDITREAFMKRALTRFDLLDSNDDGKVTAAERDAAQGQRGFRGHGRRGGGPQG